MDIWKVLLRLYSALEHHFMEQNSELACSAKVPQKSCITTSNELIKTHCRLDQIDTLNSEKVLLHKWNVEFSFYHYYSKHQKTKNVTAYT